MAAISVIVPIYKVEAFLHRCVDSILAQSFSDFDLVLVDAPCSGLGVIRKKPDIRYKDAQEFSALPEIQRAILENSARYVKDGGLLVYSTCTILPEENEQVTDGFLKAHDEFTYEAFSLPNGVSAPGHLTLWPQRDNTDGFYLSRMRRKTHD